MWYRQLKILLIAITGMVLCPSLAFSIDYNYSLFGSHEYTDNINQSLTEEAGGTSSAGISFSMQAQDNPSVTASLSGLLGKSWFSGFDIDDRSVKGFEGNVLISPRGSNFSLGILDSYSQVPRQRFVTERLDNITDVNVIAILPRYFARLSSKDEFVVEYSYIQVNDGGAGLTPGEADSSRKTYRPAFGYQRRLSSASQLGVFVRESDVEFEEMDLEYTETSQFLRWSGDYGLTRISIDAGETEIEAVSGIRDRTTKLLEMSVFRTINRSSTFSISHRKGFGDALNLNVGNEGVDFNISGQANLIDEILEERNSSVRYDYRGSFISSGITLGRSQLDGVESERREVGDDASFFITYQLGRALNSSLGSSITFRHDYRLGKLENDGRETEENVSSLRLEHFPNQNVLVFFEYRFRDAQNTSLVNNVVTDINVDENIFQIGFSFSPRGRIQGL